ncbi:hypothetical protein ACIOJD_22750 [Streptomyces sp. NPDC088116]|uniref:hypothetical protein n=1 Tax=Streptomyces sp. NPDC088116 TaxID=3365825 RepID=UPI00381B7007
MENALTDALTAVVIVALVAAGYVVIHMLNAQHRQSITTHTYGRTLWDPQNRAATRALRGEPTTHGAHPAGSRHGHHRDRLRFRGPWAHSHDKHGSGTETVGTETGRTETGRTSGGSTGGGSTGGREPPRP